MTCCAGMAWLRRGVVRKDCTRAKVEQATQTVGLLRKKGNKGSRQQAAAICEKDGNCEQHQRVELKTAVTSGKRRTDLQDPQEDPRAGIHEANKWDVQRVSENEEMDLVERLVPSKNEKRDCAWSRNRKCRSTGHL
jgi:hypothetical protein